MNLKKGDNVQVISGKDKGQSGTILRIDAVKDRVTVKDINVFKKRQRAKKQGQKGETVNVARSIAASNIMLICKNCKKPARVGYRFDGDTKVRYCKKCDAST